MRPSPGLTSLQYCFKAGLHGPSILLGAEASRSGVSDAQTVSRLALAMVRIVRPVLRVFIESTSASICIGDDPRPRESRSIRMVDAFPSPCVGAALLAGAVPVVPSTMTLGTVYRRRGLMIAKARRATVHLIGVVTQVTLKLLP